MSSTVGEVAREAGVSPHTVRFYEQHGLIAAERTPGNQRRFDANTACRIKVARVAQRIGLTVADVRAMLDTLPPAPTVDDWHRLEDALAAEAERRISELRAVLADIRSDQKLCAIQTTAPDHDSDKAERSFPSTDHTDKPQIKPRRRTM